ncbi:uncharacterized protein LOC126826784 [Patella vulgata]|uniref:uncharacterized protein LOC126826784 n=1 Tax=Patella vulgata TaxID=6465 RepID=UPI0024A98940|nr:uncharacterized protein LOC126826784 [Patella vulgata]
MNLQQGSSLWLVLLVCGVAYSMPKPAQTTVDAKCPALAMCSRFAYRNLFGSYDYADSMVKMFNDVMNSITDYDKPRTRKVWTAYVDNVMVCAHLAPVRGKGLGVGPRNQQNKDESTTLNKPLLGSSLDDDSYNQLKKREQPEVGDIKYPIPLSDHLKSFDPTHPLTRDLKAAIESVLSNHTAAIMEKLNITGEGYTTDKLIKQLTLIDQCVKEHKANKAQIGKGSEARDGTKIMESKGDGARKPKGSEAVPGDAKHGEKLTDKGLTGTGIAIVTTSLLIPVALFLIRLC